MSKLTDEQIDEAYNYILSVDEIGSAKLAGILGTEDDGDAIQTALNQVRRKYPKLKQDAEAAKAARNKQPEPQVEKPLPPKPTVEEIQYKYSLANESGFSEELEVMGIKGNVVHLKKIVPTEIVTVKLGGKDVDVDLVKVRKMGPTEQIHGVSAQTLLVIAAAAKA